MRIGILGGTFNPVHNAHLQMAALARDALSLDRVLLMVAADPPHKTVSGAVPGTDRLAMTELAVSGIDRVEASGLELRRTGKSYTFDTLNELAESAPGAMLFFLIGSDMLENFPTWYRPNDIARLCTLAVTPRVGEDSRDRENAERIRAEFGAEVVFLSAEADPISSTQVRNRVRDGLPVDALVPPAVERYFVEQGLYFSDEVRSMQQKLHANLKRSRYIHSCGTVTAAARLAQQWGADAKKAQIAALLHDCAKNLPMPLLEVLAGDDPTVEPVLHAHAGAVLARWEYGVTDDEILRAIRLHATGDAGMSLLDQVIFIADVVEPNRDYAGVEEIRARIPEGPDQTMLFALTRSHDRIMRNGLPLYPATERAIRYFTQKIKEDDH